MIRGLLGRGLPRPVNSERDKSGLPLTRAQQECEDLSERRSRPAAEIRFPTMNFEDQAPDSEQLLETLYQELRRLAQQRLSPGGGGASLVPTELVHEAYLRLVAGGDPRWENEGHFFASAATAMRRILVDRARAKSTLKRGGNAPRIELAEEELASEERPSELCALDDALGLLEERDPPLARLVELRYFAGLTVEETAAALETSVRTVHRDWATARAWLRVKIGEGAALE